jgi:hypothetical protein
MKKDVIVAVVCLAIAVFLYATLGHIELERARTFPAIVIIGIGVLSVILFIQTLLQKARTESADKERYPWGRFVLLFAMIVAYIGLMETVGFYVSAFLFFVAVCVVLDRQDLAFRRAAAWTGEAAGLTIVLFVLFRIVLEVQTPRGLFF